MEKSVFGILVFLIFLVSLGVLIGSLFFYNNSFQDVKITESNFVIGKTIELDKSSNFIFNIGEEEHEFYIDKINDNSVSIIIRSDPIMLDLVLDEVKKVDIDGDGYYDLKVILRGIDNKDVQFFVRKINEVVNGGIGGSVGECIQAGGLVFDESTGESLGKCCEGLMEIGDIFYDIEKTCEENFEIVGYGSICSDCGNNVCEDWENKCNCAEDCEEVVVLECASLGEQFSGVYITEYPEKCCDGLTEWNSGFDTSISIGDKCYDTMLMSGSPVGTCILLDDGVCSDIESVCNSPDDCSVGENSDYVSLGEFCNVKDDRGETAYDYYCEDEFASELELCGLCGGLIDCSVADLDNDGNVTLKDFNLFVNNPSDLDLDGIINISSDFKIIKECWQEVGLIRVNNIVCEPGQKIGDANGDGILTIGDSVLISRIYQGLDISPSNICCLDVNGDGKLDIDDKQLLSEVLVGLISDDFGTCPKVVTCESGQRIGDVNGDGVISELDSEMIKNIIVGVIEEPADICCVDVDKNDVVTTRDSQFILQSIVGSRSDDFGVCSGALNCEAGQKIGDVNGDGIIDDFDVNLLVDIWKGKIVEPSNICCIDVDKNGLFEDWDVLSIVHINSIGAESSGIC